MVHNKTNSNILNCLEMLDVYRLNLLHNKKLLTYLYGPEWESDPMYLSSSYRYNIEMYRGEIKYYTQELKDLTNTN